MGTMTRSTRLVRCGLIATTVLAAGLVSATPAGAARFDAADFAADCNDDGVVSVSGTQRYVGGVGTISGYCRIDLTSSSTLVLRDVELSGTSLVAGLNTVENATIKVIDSSIELSDPDPAAFGGVLQLSTGGEGDEPGANGRIVIRNSTITAGTIQVQTSFDWPGGTVVVRDSTLTTTVSNLSLEASAVGGDGGFVKVLDSVLRTAEDIIVTTGIAGYVGPGGGQNGLTSVVSSSLEAPSGSIEVTSGQGGRTTVRRSVLSASVVALATGAGGTCQSNRNVPAIACA